MTVEQKAQAVLIAAAGTIGVAATNIRTPGNWQNLTPPYIVHFPASMTPEHTFEALMTFRIYDFYQVSVFAATYGIARGIMDRAITALNGKHGDFTFRLSPGPIYAGRDDEVNLEHLVANFTAAGNEA